MGNCVDLIETIGARSAESPEALALVFVDHRGVELARYTYGQFWEVSCSIASEIQESLHPGDRVVLAVTSGPGAVLTFLGCLCAGVLPVIATAPRHRNDQARLSRLTHILAATQPRRLYVSSESDGAIEPGVTPPGCQRIVFNESDSAPTAGFEMNGASLWRRPDINGSSPAYIQFTSGSSGRPRGVLLVHSNVLANLTAIHRVFGHDRDFRGFSWLPLHHDMGLVGHVLEPLSRGASSVLAPPSLFSFQPLAWLSCISRFRATDSGAPPFAYRMCALRPGELPADLELSCWRNAYCGAETIAPDVLEQFAARFSARGFRRAAFLPCYGLAEATLLAAGGRELIHQAGRLSYALLPEVGMRVLHPENNEEATAGELGEICISGPCVGRTLGEGTESRDAFVSVNGVETRFLRTGDMGSIFEGRLRLAGRKDGLMIVRGVKYYPEDVEGILSAIPEMAGEGAAVCFSTPGSETSEIVVLQEIRRTRPEEFRDLTARIHSAVNDGCGLTLSAVALVRQGGILRTSSGKISRAENRTAWIAGKIQSQFVLRRSPQTRDRSRDIAVIGMACRFPKAPDLDSFWNLLSSGVDAIEEVPADRWDWRDYYSPEVAPGKMNTRWGGFLDGVYEFDAAFFGIPDHEALEMDQQQRLVLEVAWRAIEHAGLPLDRLRRRGVILHQRDVRAQCGEQGLPDFGIGRGGRRNVEGVDHTPLEFTVG